MCLVRLLSIEVEIYIISGYVQTDKVLNTFSFEGIVLSKEIGRKMIKTWFLPKGACNYLLSVMC